MLTYDCAYQVYLLALEKHSQSQSRLLDADSIIMPTISENSSCTLLFGAVVNLTTRLGDPKETAGCC